MRWRILALVERTIGTRLLLASRLGLLGYEVVMPYTWAAFKQHLQAERFDWLMLDADELPTPRQASADYVTRHRGEARIVWCGSHPPPRGVSVEATFEKPLRYDEISRFFGRRERGGAAAPDDDGAGSRERTGG